MPLRDTPAPAAMYDVLLAAQAPLVFRSGRPFGAGSRDGANFPWPSSFAGLLRSATLAARGWPPILSDAQAAQLAGLAAQGPFLARREGGVPLTPLFARPADAVRFFDAAGGRAVYRRLRPAKLPDDSHCDLPDDLQALSFAQPILAKPLAAPDFWPLPRWLEWRRGVAIDGEEAEEEPEAASLAPLKATRTHVALADATQAADPGALFHSEGLDLDRRRVDGRFAASELVFLGRFAAELPPTHVVFGGKRRLSWLEPAPAAALAAPEEYLQALAGARRLTLTLLTPALFDDGWRPRWLAADGLLPGLAGLRLKLVAAAVHRWQGVSGWDLHRRASKPARKAVAAGATYWCEIVGEPPADWPRRLWLAAISDAEQDRLDGFGLVAPGPWLND